MVDAPPKLFHLLLHVALVVEPFLAAGGASMSGVEQDLPNNFQDIALFVALYGLALLSVKMFKAHQGPSIGENNMKQASLKGAEVVEDIQDKRE